MNLNKIQYFLSAVEEQSFTKAAKRHYVTQVAMSQQIASLEKELGIELFERNGNQIRVTQAGRLFYAEMKKIVEQYRFTLEQLQEYKENGAKKLKIGISLLDDYEWIMPHLSAFLEEHPDMEYSFVTGTYEELLGQLKVGKLSMIFSREIYGDDRAILKMIPAYDTKISIVANDKSPLFDMREAGIWDLADLPLILVGAGEQNGVYHDFYQLCKNTGFIPRIACHVENNVEAMIKVDMGLGHALYMEDVSGILAEHPKRRILTLHDPVKIQKYLIYRYPSWNPRIDEFMLYLARKTGTPSDTGRADLKSDFSALWREALKQDDGTYSRRLSDDQAEKEFWHHFMEKKSTYQQDGWAHTMLREVKELISPYQISTILEIGPGWGNFTMELADCCDMLTCVDISEDVLQYIEQTAKELGKKNIFTICSKWEDMTCDRNYDIVFGYNCFYRMLDLKECVNIMNRIAARLCIMGMSIQNLTPCDRELQETLGAEVKYDKKDYIYFVNTLYQMGIDANVKVVPLTREVAYRNWEETLRGVMSRIHNRETLLELQGEAVDRILHKYFKQAEDGSYHGQLSYRGTLVYWESLAH